MTAFPIVGAHFRPPAKAILEALAQGTPLTLRPEPDNPFDPNAIKVILLTSDLTEAALTKIAELAPMFGSSREDIETAPEWHLGYIPRTLNQPLALEMAGLECPAKLSFSATGAPQVTRA